MREACSGFCDSRRSADGSYTMAEIGLSAFSLFFMQSESFLAHQKRLLEGHGTSNCQTLFGIERIPTDNHIRTLLDAVSPEALQPCFDQVLAGETRSLPPIGAGTEPGFEGPLVLAHHQLKRFCHIRRSLRADAARQNEEFLRFPAAEARSGVPDGSRGRRSKRWHFCSIFVFITASTLRLPNPRDLSNANNVAPVCW